MLNNRYYSGEFHGSYELISIGQLDLEEGGVIPDCQLAVATFGSLNPAKSNAVLITTWYSGTHQIWREQYIGTGHALDPSEYFIVVVNQIGSGLSVSPHNAAGANAQIAMSKFPHVRISDDVIAQERLLRTHFGIETLHAVIGGSMGAQQTYEWAVRFPDKVKRAVPIAGTAQNSPHDFLFTKALIEAITSDPAFADGEYSSNTAVVEGLKRHAGIWAVMGFSTAFWKRELWRPLGFETKEAFVEGFLEPYFTAMDPNDLLCMAWKWQRGDVARNAGGDLKAALARVTAKTLVLPISEDMFFPVADCQDECLSLPDGALAIIDDVAGHLGLFAISPTYMPQVDSYLAELLSTRV